ncbi:hypothetical protein ACW2QC_09420 [Virgibacillus sp. FSP13]
MLQRKGGKWRLYPIRVEYTQHGETIEQWAVEGKEWWIDFAEKWDHTTVEGFTEVELSDEQIARFEQIKDMPEDFMDMYVDYILTGSASDDIELPTNHPFQVIRLKKENESLRIENKLIKVQSQAMSDRADFIDDVIAEMAMQVYQ